MNNSPNPSTLNPASPDNTQNTEEALTPLVARHLRELFEEKIAFDRNLGLKITSLALDGPEMRFDMQEHLVGNPLRQVLHGGVIASSLDALGGLSVMLALYKAYPDKRSPIQLMELFRYIGTIDLRIDYLQPGSGAWFTAKSQVLRLGKRIAYTSMRLHNDQNELIATGNAAFIVS